jgi:hypothetical protein
MQLTNRDLKLIEYIKDQGFVTYAQIYSGFFTSKSSCSRRMGLLNTGGLIEQKSLREYFNSSHEKYYFPHLLPLGIDQSTQIITLSKRLRKLYPDYDLVFKKDILLHQLYLGRVRNYLSKKVPHDYIISEYEIKLFANFMIDRNKDIYPDLSFEGPDLKLALEMERTKKTFDRYFSKFYNFYDSSYSHVLYIFINRKSLKSVMGLTKIYRKIGFALFENLDEVYSPIYGKLKFDDWIAKIRAISGAIN